MPEQPEGAVKNEYFSDNSQSLPGILGVPGPIGFEPGMFRRESDTESSHSRHHKGDNLSKVSFI